MLGPDYTEMFGILLRYIAKEKPGAKVAFVYSDTEFGRDPIASSRAVAEKLGLKVVTEIMTPPGSVDVSTEVIRCAAPIRTTPSSTATCWRRFRNSSGRASAWA